MFAILKKPLISEKTVGLSKQNFYTFLVDKKARKPEVAKAVKDQFNVDVLSVKMMTMKPETKQQRTRRGYFTVPGLKKAIVVVKAGQKIDLFDLEAQAQPEETVTVTTAEGEPIAEVKEKKSRLKGTKVKIEKVKEETK